MSAPEYPDVLLAKSFAKASSIKWIPRGRMNFKNFRPRRFVRQPEKKFPVEAPWSS